MSVGNKPAYPNMLKASDNPCNFTITNPGLTFRERLIVAAVQGLCANSYDLTCNAVTCRAIQQADAVIAALEKEDAQ